MEGTDSAAIKVILVKNVISCRQIALLYFYQMKNKKAPPFRNLGGESINLVVLLCPHIYNLHGISYELYISGIFPHHLHKFFRQLRIELASRTVFYLPQSFLFAHSFLIGPAGCHNIVGIDY